MFGKSGFRISLKTIATLSDSLWPKDNSRAYELWQESPSFSMVRFHSKNEQEMDIRDRRLSDKKSMFAVSLIVLLSETCRGILIPTLWLRVKSVGGTPSGQGITVACLSFGKLIGSLFLGLSADCFSYKSSLFGSTLLIVLGSLAYVFAETLNTLFVAQLVLGLGAGSLSVGRSYFTEITPEEKKVSVMAYLYALQNAGYTLLPFVGALIASKTRNYGYTIETPLYGRINQLTMPAVALGTFAVTSGLFVLLLFKEPSSADDSRPTSQCQSKEEDEELARVVSSEPVREYDARMRRIAIYAIIGCLLQILVKSAIASFETLVVIFAVDKFDWNEMQTGTSISIGGVLSIVLLLCFPLLLKICTDVDLVIFGLLSMIVSNLLLDKFFIPYQLNEWRFLLSIILMFGVGYPVCDSAFLGIFSKMVSGGAGGSMGVYSAFGSMARIIAPIFAGAGTEKFDASAVFTTIGLLLTGAVLVVVIGRGKVIRDLH